MAFPRDIAEWMLADLEAWLDNGLLTDGTASCDIAGDVGLSGDAPLNEAEEPLIQLTETQELVLAWLGDKSRRLRSWERSAVQPDSPAPGGQKAIARILDQLHELGLVHSPVRCKARILPAGLRWLNQRLGC